MRRYLDRERLYNDNNRHGELEDRDSGAGELLVCGCLPSTKDHRERNNDDFIPKYTSRIASKVPEMVFFDDFPPIVGVSDQKTHAATRAWLQPFGIRGGLILCQTPRSNRIQ